MKHHTSQNATRMRVLHVIKRLDVPRGAERMVAEMVRRLPEHDVLVYEGGDSAYELGSGKLIRARNPIHALWLLLKAKRAYDFVHLHLRPTIYFAVFLGRRSIVHEHNTHHARRKKIVPRLLSKIAMHRTAAVIAVGEEARRAVLARMGEGVKVFALPNFVARLPDAEAKPSQAKELLMVAAFDGPKRQDALIRALPFLPEHIGVVFAGTGPKLEDCRRLAADLGLKHRVTFLGAVRDISAQYANASLCVLLSEYEGYPLVVLEAAQFGKATLVSDIVGLRESCPDDRLLYKGRGAEDLAIKIKEILNICDDDTMRQKMIDFADQRDLAQYSLKLEKIYAKCKN